MTFGLRPRTRDIDFLVIASPTVREAIERTATDRGWRVEVKAAWHLRLWRDRFYCDVILGATQLEREAVANAEERLLGGLRVRTIGAEYLCALKLLAGRPQDLRDVGEIHDNWATLDVDKINELLRSFDLRWDVRPGEVVPTLVELAAAHE